jgi:hypothetical protein
LQRNQMHYRHERRRSLADGRLSSRERRNLNSMKRFDSRRIYAMKHNARRRVF